MNPRAVGKMLVLLLGTLTITTTVVAEDRSILTVELRTSRPLACESEGSRGNCFGALELAALEGSGWKMVRSKGPKDGEDIVSIMQTADTLHSDPDFAGLMIRCGAQGKIDVLVVLVLPFPPQSTPQVTVSTGQTSKTFDGKMAAAGAAIILPEEAGFLAGGPWQMAPTLAIAAREGGNEIKGVVSVGGLKAAYGNLVGSCAH